MRATLKFPVAACLLKQPGVSKGDVATVGKERFFIELA